MNYVTEAGSEVRLLKSGSFVADWDWFEEHETCIDARPVDVLEDAGRLLVTVQCGCCGDAVVPACVKEASDDG